MAKFQRTFDWEHPENRYSKYVKHTFTFVLHPKTLEYVKKDLELFGNQYDYYAAKNWTEKK